MPRTSKVRAEKIPTTLLIDSDLHDWLQDQKRNTGAPVSWFVNNLVRKARDKEQAAAAEA